MPMFYDGKKLQAVYTNDEDGWVVGAGPTESITVEMVDSHMAKVPWARITFNNDWPTALVNLMKCECIHEMKES
jgi:hypothetical protein